MRVLYVTRKFPPSVGGMEKAAYELHRSLAALLPVKLVAYGGPNKYLPVVYPWLFVRALLATYVWRPDVIYLQDGVMAPIGFLLRFLTRKPIVMSVHGLEVTFENGFYKALMKRVVPSVNRIVIGSEQTKAAVLKRFPDAPLAKVTYGVRDDFYVVGTMDELRAQLANKLQLDSTELVGKKLLVTTGRLVDRKGVAWLVEQVMPGLIAANPDVRYLVAGKGPNEDKIRKLIETQNLTGKVYLLGYISDEVRNLLYTSADYFLMPNIPVPNDMEGFGLVAVEAASCGTPVIASGIEGITDAVVEGKTGMLLPAADAAAYQRVLVRELARPSLSRESVRHYVLKNYSWPQAAAGYRAVFEDVLTTPTEQ